MGFPSSFVFIGVCFVVVLVVIIIIMTNKTTVVNNSKTPSDKNSTTPTDKNSTTPSDKNLETPSITNTDDEFDDVTASREPPKRVTAYFTNWPRYRAGNAYLPSNIPTDKVTDIVYAFFPISDAGEVAYSDPWADINNKQISETVALRGKGRVKHVLYSIGGWTYSGPGKKKTFKDENDLGTMNTLAYQDIWDKVLKTKDSRAKFITSAITMMNRHSFDGIDIDYEYPVCPNGECNVEKYGSQKETFILLLQELRAALGSKKLLTLATAAAESNLNMGPSVKAISDIADYINVMTYDYFVAAGLVTGHNQPKKNEKTKNFDVNHTLWYYLKAGCDPTKLNIGMATYGRGYKLSVDDYNTAKSTGKVSGIKGSMSASTKWIQEAGVSALFEFKTEYPSAKSIYVKDEGSWLFDDSTNTVMSYTDLKDIQALNEIRIRKKIGGVLIYAVDQDDYNNTLGFGVSPLTSSLYTIDSMSPVKNMIPELSLGA